MPSLRLQVVGLCLSSIVVASPYDSFNWGVSDLTISDFHVGFSLENVITSPYNTNPQCVDTLKEYQSCGVRFTRKDSSSNGTARVIFSGYGAAQSFRIVLAADTFSLCTPPLVVLDSSPDKWRATTNFSSDGCPSTEPSARTVFR